MFPVIRCWDIGVGGLQVVRGQRGKRSGGEFNGTLLQFEKT